MFRRQSGEMILNEYNNRPRDIRNRPHRLYIIRSHRIVSKWTDNAIFDLKEKLDDILRYI